LTLDFTKINKNETFEPNKLITNSIPKPNEKNNDHNIKSMIYKSIKSKMKENLKNPIINNLEIKNSPSEFENQPSKRRSFNRGQFSSRKRDSSVNSERQSLNQDINELNSIVDGLYDEDHE